MSTTPVKPPEILDKIVDLVLKYKPKKKGASEKKKSSRSPSAGPHPKLKSKQKHS
jgi:hypothetical protein